MLVRDHSHKMQFSVLTVVLFWLLLAGQALGATYYIDFASGADTNSGTAKSAPWKRAPGMNGFAGTYTHAAGDRFIFKGGVTWDASVFTWTISGSGTASNVDYYGTDTAWFTGSRWSQPVFDGNMTFNTSSQIAVDISGSFVIVDNLSIQNLGRAYYYNGAYAVRLNNNHDVTVRNCTIAPNVRVGILVNDSVAGTTLSNYTLEKNDISKVSWGLGIAPSANDAVMSNVVVANNAIHDFATQMCGGAHGDGIIMFRGNPGATSGNYIASAYVYGNKFYGDFHTDPSYPSCVANDTPPSGSCNAGNPCGMNAFLYVERPQNTSMYVYNNSMTYSSITGYNGSVTTGNALINIVADTGYSNNFYLYNNSVLADSNLSHGFAFSNVASSVIKNNIISGTQFPLITNDLTSCSGMVADRNNYYNFTSGTVAALPAACGGFQSWAQYHTANAKEPNSLSVNPQFVAGGGFLVQSGSPVVGKGENLHTVFAADAGGTPRPEKEMWDMGAYQLKQRPDAVTNAQATAK